MTTVTAGAPMLRDGCSSGRVIDVPIPQLEPVEGPYLIVARIGTSEEGFRESCHCSLVEEAVTVSSSQRVEDVVPQVRAQPGAERNAETLLALLENLRREVRGHRLLQDVLGDASPDL